jgi:hypothetical protein
VGGGEARGWGWGGVRRVSLGLLGC